MQVDPIESKLEVKTERVVEKAVPDPGEIKGGGRFGYLLSRRANASILAVNRLLNDGEQVYVLNAENSNKKKEEAGTFVIESKGDSTRERVQKLAEELGLDFKGIDKKPSGKMQQLKPARIGLYKSWVGNMDEGWTRWLLKEYAFAVDTLHDEIIRNTDLSQYNAIILPHQSARRILHGHRPGTMPEEFTGGLGLEGTLALKRFAEQGGTIIAFDGASDFAIEQFGLPVENVVSRVSSRQFFIPGSLVKIQVEADHPLGYGMQKEAAASFIRSRAFEIVRLDREGEGGKEDIPEAPAAPVEVVARYATKDILMSGWALGEKKYIGGKAAMMRVRIGKGAVVLFGFRPQFRGQSRGTYKLLFNALLNATLDEVPTSTGQEPTDGLN